jgi:hypothetical protein
MISTAVQDGGGKIPRIIAPPTLFQSPTDVYVGTQQRIVSEHPNIYASQKWTYVETRFV